MDEEWVDVVKAILTGIGVVLVGLISYLAAEEMERFARERRSLARYRETYRRTMRTLESRMTLIDGKRWRPHRRN